VTPVRSSTRCGGPHADALDNDPTTAASLTGTYRFAAMLSLTPGAPPRSAGSAARASGPRAVALRRVGQCLRSRRAIGVVRCCTPASIREPIDSSAGSNPSCRLTSNPS
jgi:hypothetical protein